MGLYKYSMAEEEGVKTAKAQQHDMSCSYKDLSQVFAAIRGKTVAGSRKVLDDAIAMKKAIRYHKFATKIGHRSNLGGKKGRYPKKECKIALSLLENAVANAVQKGMDESALYVMHAASYKQNVLKRYRKYFASSRTLGYGKQSTWSNYVTCWAEMVLGEKQVPEGKKKQGEAKIQVKAPAAAKAKESVQQSAPKKKPAEKAPEEKKAAAASTESKETAKPKAETAKV
ncbi:50S ribosomal protein L22 [Candidatus Micrarchaeota archaeon]|nr:50S ribosomal protein L22 [Candidatus Micrarchaeota archaeon]